MTNRKKLILDAGCGRGRLEKKLSRKGRYVGIDVGDFLLTSSKMSGDSEFILASLDHISIKDNTFDEIYCIDVLEHVADVDNTVSELSRVIIPTGIIHIYVPHGRSEKIAAKFDPLYFSDKMHRRIFTQQTLQALLAKYKFKMVKMKNQHFFSALRNSWRAFSGLPYEEQIGAVLTSDRIYNILTKILEYIEKTHSILKSREDRNLKKYPYLLFGLPLILTDYLFGKIYPKSIYAEAIKLG